MVIKRGRSGVTFVYRPAGSAKKVSLVGSFNAWDPERGLMRKQKDGTFRRREELGPGRYEYRFLVDGQWVTDPACDQVVPNSFGTENSTVVVP